jgi:hypothetical protein
MAGLKLRGVTEWVSEARAPLVRERLRAARAGTRGKNGQGTIGYTSTQKAINAWLRENGFIAHGMPDRYTEHSVRRYEGSDLSRHLPPIPVEYVRAAAHVFGCDPAKFLAEDIPADAKGLGQLSETVKTLKDAGYAIVLPHKKEPPAALRHQQELEREVRAVFAQASDLPRTLGVSQDSDPVCDAHRAFERLFWRAFAGRGLSDVQLLELAAEIGRRVITPDRLPRVGFRGLSQLTEEEYRLFWRLQVSALEVLARPPAHDPEGADLREWEDEVAGRLSLSWGERTQKWDAAPDHRSYDQKQADLAESIANAIATLDSLRMANALVLAPPPEPAPAPEPAPGPELTLSAAREAVAAGVVVGYIDCPWCTYHDNRFPPDTSCQRCGRPLFKDDRSVRPEPL